MATGKLYTSVDAFYDSGTLPASSTWKSVGISFNTLFLYKYVTLCLIISNNDNRSINSITLPTEALRHGMAFEVPFTTDGSLQAAMQIRNNDSETGFMYNTGTGGWKCRFLLSR